MGRQMRIACLGNGRDWIVRLACLCIEAAREDDAFEFMIDSHEDAAVAHETAVCVEMLWNDLPNVALAHLSGQRHTLLLGAQLVVDFSACTAARENAEAASKADGNAREGTETARGGTETAGAESASADTKAPGKADGNARGGLSSEPLVIDDWEHPVPHGARNAPGSAPFTAEEARSQLMLDMSLLCPRAVMVAPPADVRFDEVVGAALTQALEQAAST